MTGSGGVGRPLTGCCCSISQCTDEVPSRIVSSLWHLQLMTFFRTVNIRRIIWHRIGERGLRVFGNRVLRRRFGPKRGEVTGVEKTTRLGALRCVLLTRYFSGYQIKKNEMVRACSTYGGEDAGF